MSIRKRQKSSGALIFQPTPVEEKQVKEQKEMREELSKVKELRQELEGLVNEQKKNKE